MAAEDEAFLNAILETPEDDLPRLAYADYLDECGDAARAEFIRVQIVLAGGADNSALDARQNELQRDHPEWRLPIRGIQRFHRGFVEAMATTADWLISSELPILLSAPVRELRIINADNFIGELVKVPGLDRIETLDLRNNSFGTRHRLNRFLDEAPLTRLNRLLLMNNQLWSDDVQVLVRSERAIQLRSLELSGNAIGDNGAAALARAENLGKLRSLILRSDDLDWRDRITGVGAEALAQSTALVELRTLELGGHLIGESGVAALARGPGMPNLSRIDVSHNRLGLGEDTDFDELMAAPPRPNLRYWNLAGSHITRSASIGFCQWPALATLREVDLQECSWEENAREWMLANAPPGKFRLDTPVLGDSA